jgi:exopolysaccharide biosynthesis protein
MKGRAIISFAALSALAACGLNMMQAWASLPAQAGNLKNRSAKELLALGFVPTPMPHMRSHSALRRGVYLNKNRNSSWSRLGKSSTKSGDKDKASGAATSGQSPASTSSAPVAPAQKSTRNAAASNFALKTISVKEIYQGVFYKVFSGQLPSGGRARINLLDINMSTSPVRLRPVTGSYAFSRLKDVREHSRDSGAIAAINANYFKSNGIPLGTLIQDGDWLAGPLYDRVTLGFTKGGYARIDRVSLHGLLYTDSVEHPVLWVNNVNQPRRTGSHCILYTRHWGAKATLPYPGVLIAVDANGRVIDRDDLKLDIPYGGYVLADSKGSAIASLKSGESVNIRWKISPGDWDNVVEAVSGGPLLLKDGKLALDLKKEKFPSSFVGSHIHQRTACGITSDDHLLLATFEGPHTMYDVAKFFQSHNCSEAMNLDGGGSTTMVVDGRTVTANAHSSQRRVAVALGVFPPEKARALESYLGTSYRPREDLSSLVGTSFLPYEKIYRQAENLEAVDPLMTKLMHFDFTGQSDTVREASVSLPAPASDDEKAD